MTAGIRQQRQGVFLIALSAFGFGTLAIFARLANAHGADLYGALMLRFWIAGLLLLAFAWRRKLPWPNTRRIAQLAAMGGVGYVSMSYCYFAALNFIPASLVVLLLYTYPLIVCMLAALFLHEKLTPAKLLVLLLCAMGTALIIGNQNLHGASMPLQGVALAIGAAVIYASYITAGAKLTLDIDPVITATIVCLASAGVFSLIAVIRWQLGLPPHFPSDWLGWGGIAGVALLATVVAVIAFFAGLKRVGAAQASMLSTLEPVVTVALASWFLSESLTPWQWLGGALTLAAVIWLASLGEARQ
jgi:drug/metabolite transporter (DMT)-like permease